MKRYKVKRVVSLSQSSDEKYLTLVVNRVHPGGTMGRAKQVRFDVTDKILARIAGYRPRK